MIDIDDLRFRYRGGGFSLHVREFHIANAEKVALIGPSGAGKSTLLRLMAGIERPHSGTVRVAGAALHAMNDAARRNFRATRIGFVFQELELLEYLNVFDNILHAYRVNRVLKLDAAVRERARRLADEIGLGTRLARTPKELSQGERQRTAVGRALLPQPTLLLADEATGNLDPANKVRILDLLFRAADEQGATLLAVTHDHELLARFDRVIDFASLH